MTPLYRLHGIRKRYDDRMALAVDKLELFADRLYLLAGANGSGKSTLLAILAFLLAPTQGEIFFRGERVERKNASLLKLRREVTLLHQAPYLFRESVAANVAFGLRVRGVAGREERRRVDEALDLVGLSGFQKRKARELSGGEAQRVALARALVLSPRVLLLDEPLANVDRESARLIGELVLSLPARGTTVVMTSHDPEHPERFGGEQLHLAAGELAPPPGAGPYAIPKENAHHAHL